MSLKPVDAFPAQHATPDADYPDGGARNDIVADDNLGTPWIADLLNDIWGFHQALQVAGGVTASGSPDTALASDKLTALQNLIAAVSSFVTGDTVATVDTGIIARGFLLRSGGEADRTAEAALFAKTGVKYGAGDGSSTFNLPPGPMAEQGLYSSSGSFVIPVGGSFVNISNVAVNPVTDDTWFGEATVPPKIWKSAGGAAAYVDTGSYTTSGGDLSRGIAVDPENGDVISGDSNDHLYKLALGAGSFAQLGDLPADIGGTPNIRGIALDRYRKHIYVADQGNNKILMLPRGDGAGTYIEIGDIAGAGVTLISDVVVNSNLGHIYVLGSAGGNDGVWVLRNGLGKFTLLADTGLTGVVGMGINESSNDLFLSEADEVYRMDGTMGEVYAVGAFPTIGAAGLAGNSSTGDVLLGMANAGTGAVYKLTGVVEREPLLTYIKT